MERTIPSAKLPIGSKIPHFSLPNVDGRSVDDSFFHSAKAGLVLFTCNHCPYVKGSEHLLVEVAKKYIPKGLKIVTINSNDAVMYPEDSFEKMKEKSADLKLPYPYLLDAGQTVAKRFDAQCTPESFLFDKEGFLVFHGAINDSPRDSSKVQRSYLADAVQAVLEGSTPEPQFAHPLGCSIKWK